jgi:HPt (histidine-containing phosphotransfer) domain-containing protein
MSVHINLLFLEENTQGDPELMSELIEIFLHTTPPMLEELDRFYEGKEWNMLRKSAHKLKSNLFTLGIHELTAPILMVEQFTGEDAHLVETGGLIKKIREVSQLAFNELELELEKFKKK